MRRLIVPADPSVVARRQRYDRVRSPPRVDAATSHRAGPSSSIQRRSRREDDRSCRTCRRGLTLLPPEPSEREQAHFSRARGCGARRPRSLGDPAPSCRQGVTLDRQRSRSSIRSKRPDGRVAAGGLQRAGRRSSAHGSSRTSQARATAEGSTASRMRHVRRQLPATRPSDRPVQPPDRGEPARSSRRRLRLSTRSRARTIDADA